MKARKRGRPSKYTPRLAREICERLSVGEPLAAICRDQHMPAVRTVSHWKEADAAFLADFTRARDEGFDALAAQCMEIADDERHDWQLSKKSPITNEVAIIRARLRVETRLKLLAKWDPKRYGERLDLHHAGSLTLTKANLTDAELEAIAAGGSAGAAGPKKGEGEP